MVILVIHNIGMAICKSENNSPIAADFYCPEHKLAIELDGGIHNNVVVHNNDVKRQEHLESLEIKVLRYDNEDVFNNLEGVLDSILEAVNGN